MLFILIGFQDTEIDAAKGEVFECIEIKPLICMVTIVEKLKFCSNSKQN